MKNKDGIVLKPMQVWGYEDKLDVGRRFRIIGPDEGGSIVFRRLDALPTAQCGMYGSADPTANLFDRLYKSHDGANLSNVEHFWVEGSDCPTIDKMEDIMIWRKEGCWIPVRSVAWYPENTYKYRMVQPLDKNLTAEQCRQAFIEFRAPIWVRCKTTKLGMSTEELSKIHRLADAAAMAERGKKGHEDDCHYMQDCRSGFDHPRHCSCGYGKWHSQLLLDTDIYIDRMKQ